MRDESKAALNHSATSPSCGEIADPRIRPLADLPSFAVAESASSRRYPYRMIFETDGARLELRYRRTAWRRVGDSERVHHRQTFIWAGPRDAPWGAFQFVEYRTGVGFGRHFRFCMDDESYEDGALADALSSAWSDDPFAVGRLGSVLEVTAAWIRSGAGDFRRWTEIADHVLGALFPEHAIMVMQAMPLEYVGHSSPRSKYRAGFVARRAAMLRHYAALFGARPLSGLDDDDDGWLWLPNPERADLVPEPKARPIEANRAKVRAAVTGQSSRAAAPL